MFTVTKEQIIEAFKATHLTPASMAYLSIDEDGSHQCGCAIGALYLHRGGDINSVVNSCALTEILDFLGITDDEEASISGGFSHGKHAARHGSKPWLKDPVHPEDPLYLAAWEAAKELFAPVQEVTTANA